ncbi:Methylated-DNA--protein-cysteine methyltransferase [bioreactor metagenome]|uniref:methylated-DNA--[protein]-cysteine S-methyltransferase n=1 Tax=bioreactor metagenome TaxID=1076179 RepID=A0A644TMJ1_9ZZZZ|nr:methylated-DNA--[protein]-cysteine S-methyltransferase [Negativicutes bacterium]
MKLPSEYSTFLTDWGYIIAVWSNSGLWELSFPRLTVEAAAGDIDTRLEDIQPNDDMSAAAALKFELNLYFRGFNTPFTVPVDWRGYTPFQTAVLKLTAGLCYGKITTYGAVAGHVGCPKAARAVGGALHINRTPIIVPCHRVVGSNGKLTGFGGGLEMKKALLILEKGIASASSKRI